MKKLLLLLLLAVPLFAQYQATANVAQSANVQNNSTGTIFADLNLGVNGAVGIDSLTTQTLGPGISNGTRFLGSNFFVAAVSSATLDTVAVIPSASVPAPCGALYSGNWLQFAHPLAQGGQAFGTYLYLEPTASNGWSGNPYSKGDVWWSYIACDDAATDTYLNNTSAQYKILLQRTDSGVNYQQANNNAGSPGYGIIMDNFSWGCCGAQYALIDDPTTGVTFAGKGGASGTRTAGATVKCHGWRDNTLHKYQVQCKINGIERVNTVTGVCGSGSGCSGGITNMNEDSTTATTAFHIGNRFFAVCTNACSGPTNVNLYITNVVVANYNDSARIAY